MITFKYRDGSTCQRKMGTLCLGLTKYPGTEMQQFPYMFLVPLEDRMSFLDNHSWEEYNAYIIRLQGMCDHDDRETNPDIVKLVRKEK